MAGRKKIVWSEKQFQQFESLCALQCTKEEICLVLQISEKTLSRLLKERYGMDFQHSQARFSAVGKVSLRRIQHKIAEHGSSQMAIWLGKQYLAQREPAQEIRQLDGADNADLTNIPTDWVRAVEATGDIAISPELEEMVRNAEKESK